MYTLTIEQGYHRTSFLFEDVHEALEMMLVAKKSAASDTRITLECVVEGQGEENDND